MHIQGPPPCQRFSDRYNVLKWTEIPTVTKKTYLPTDYPRPFRPQVRLYGLSNNGSCGFLFGSLHNTGCCNIVDFLPISLTGTASSNSNARVKSSAFIPCSTWDNSSPAPDQRTLELESLAREKVLPDGCSGTAEEGQRVASRLESAKRPPECFATVLAYSRWWDTWNELSLQTKRDALKLVRIRSPQLPRCIFFCDLWL